MATTPYRALRVVLVVMSVLAAVAGLLMVFGSKSLLIRVFLHPPESEMSTLLLFVLKELGGFALTLSVMLFFAYRDPARNMVVIDVLMVGLCIFAITPLVSLYTTDISRLYPSWMIWGRCLGRLALAVLLLYLRPLPVLGGHA
jgi:hypothetical protein